MLEHSVAYRFLVFKSDVIEHNTIVETKNVEFFEHIFPLKVSDIVEQPIDNRLNYIFGPHFRSKISIWSLNFFLSQFGPYFGKFDAIKSFSLVV